MKEVEMFWNNIPKTIAGENPIYMKKGQNTERKCVFKNEQKYEDMTERVNIRLEENAKKYLKNNEW